MSSLEEGKCKNELVKLKADYEEFVYIVSHDLKAPLRAISNLSSWIEDDLKESGSQDIIDNVTLLKNRVKRMERMMDALLLLSRVQNKDLEILLVDIEKMCEEIVSLITNGKHVELKVQSSIPPFFTFKEKLFSVFFYLIENALKFNDNEFKKISITATQQNNFYEFSVGDNGTGIAKENIEKIFTVFYTVQAKDKYPNTGAGLAIAKKIILFVGGEISVDSEFGKGSVFKFTWPKEIKNS